MHHVFDLDHTLLKGNVSFEFGKHLYRQGFISLREVVVLLFFYGRHRYLAGSLDKLHRAVFTFLFKGKSLGLIEREVDLFLPTLLSRLTLPLAHRVKTGGLILSSSPDFLVRPLARQLGAEGKGSLYAVDAQGNFSHIVSIMDGQAKADALPSGPCTFYTDSLLDLPALEKASIPIVVGSDKKLCQLARQRGWQILPY